MTIPGEVLLFFRGAVLGFSIAAPVGPIGILCIRRTLEGGFLPGFLSGLGAAAADGLYGLAAALGLAALSSFLLEWNGPLRTGGGLFLVFLGLRALLDRSSPSPEKKTAGTPGIYGNFFSTFLLTLTNPMTILSFSAIFTSLGPVVSPRILVAGVFSGSAFWWLILCGTADRLGTMLSPSSLVWIRRGSGILLLSFALSLLFL
ncbi:MAG: LysE family transporter [Aminivibrio sp.]|jgi:threonine/homoserine/homoserine lactone efflux protein|nr:LysE family transporter [Aminivibrio sp.]